MKIGYGRVSTRDQNPDAQRDALTAAGCDQIFVDKASGKLARRPGLDKALLSASRAGDQLVVTKLDRLGRSLEHLIALSKDLQEHQVDLVVLDQGIDTSPAIGRMFFQILGSIAEFECRSARRDVLRRRREVGRVARPGGSRSRWGGICGRSGPRPGSRLRAAEHRYPARSTATRRLPPR